MFSNYVKGWYKRHSSGKDEVTFEISMIIGGIGLVLGIIMGMFWLFDHIPFIGVGLLFVIFGLVLGWWFHFIFSIKDPYYKKKKDPLDKTVRHATR